MDHATPPATASPSYTAFAGPHRVAAGSLTEVIPALKRRFDADRADLVLVFEDETGRQVDFDLRGTGAEALARALERAGLAGDSSGGARGPGRPKLGVVSREVTLLPRHWAWLEAQPRGSSATLRRLVDEARRSEPKAERSRRIRDALSRVMTALAGDRPNFEEATRALFACDGVKLAALTARWPRDVREYVLGRWQESVGA